MALIPWGHVATVEGTVKAGTPPPTTLCSCLYLEYNGYACTRKPPRSPRPDAWAGKRAEHQKQAQSIAHKYKIQT